MKRACLSLPIFEESKGPWDLYNLRATIPAAEAFRPLKESGCPLVTG
jgi:branched-chain amino acid transport system substrate-binding protein